MAIRAVILAAGQGKRMHSKQPKVLHLLAGKPLLEHVIDTALQVASLPPIVIYGQQGERLRHALAHHTLCWVEQKEPLGTAHAVLQALPVIEKTDRVFILYGDVPLISVETLKRLMAATPLPAVGLLTAVLSNAAGYGRIKRDPHHQVMSIVEEKEATAAERAILEVNAGVYLFPACYLKKWLPRLQRQNEQKEYYLTDVIAIAVQEEIPVQTISSTSVEEIYGVNDQIQLAQLERFYQKKQAEQLMRQGVRVMDPSRLDIRGEVTVGCDVQLDVNVILEGRVIIGDECTIGPQTILRHVQLGDRVNVQAHSVIEGTEVGSDCTIGPYARIRSGTVLKAHTQIGNFVELKNSLIREETKINHLSYIGDSEIGQRVNIGAGTITCNYDGVNKHKTIVHDDAFIGSCTQLIAPITVGEGATVGAGSTLTKDAPPRQLTLARALQCSVKDWQRPEEKK